MDEAVVSALSTDYGQVIMKYLEEVYMTPMPRGVDNPFWHGHHTGKQEVFMDLQTLVDNARLEEENV